MALFRAKDISQVPTTPRFAFRKLLFQSIKNLKIKKTEKTTFKLWLENTLLTFLPTNPPKNEKKEHF
jgi:hypothetical protein